MVIYPYLLLLTAYISSGVASSNTVNCNGKSLVEGISLQVEYWNGGRFLTRNNYQELLQCIENSPLSAINFSEETVLGGSTPLIRASGCGDEHLVDVLLDAGAEIEQQRPDGNRALNYAAQTRRVDVSKMLLQRGADVNARGRWGESVLHNAIPSLEGVTCDGAKLLKLLLEHGADPTATAEDGQFNGLTPLQAVAMEAMRAQNLASHRLHHGMNAPYRRRKEMFEIALQGLSGKALLSSDHPDDYYQYDLAEVLKKYAGKSRTFYYARAAAARAAATANYWGVGEL